MNQTGNGFLASLQRHRAGQVLDEASVKLAEVVAGVMATGKPGSLTVKLVVKAASRGQGAVVMTDQVSAKVPQLQSVDSFWFADGAGNLCKDDPRQRDLKFTPQAIAGGVAEPVTAPPAAAAVNG